MYNSIVVYLLVTELSPELHCLKEYFFNKWFIELEYSYGETEAE